MRRALWSAGLRYRIHDKRLPGKPDIVFASKKIALFVHGCFLHGHAGCPRHRIPKSRVKRWTAKINRNIERDLGVGSALESSGWTVFVIRECESEVPKMLQDLVHVVAGMPPTKVSKTIA